MIWTKKIILPIFVSVASLLGENSFSQASVKKTTENQYRAVHWTMENGLSTDGMNTMIKDAKGFLWFGSIYGAFCRFDGATFKKFLPDPSDCNTIISDKIMSFKEDSLQNIWIGTDKGVSRYDIKADTFTNFSPYAIPLSAPFDIAPFWATKNEILCMEPGGLITAFNIHTLKRIKLVQLSKKVDQRIHYNSNKSFF